MSQDYLLQNPYPSPIRVQQEFLDVSLYSFATKELKIIPPLERPGGRQPVLPSFDGELFEGFEDVSVVVVSEPS